MKKRLEPWLDKDLEDLPGEEWRDVTGYDGYYQVSNMGRIKSLSRFVDNGRGGWIKPAKIRSTFYKRDPNSNHQAIPNCSLNIDGKTICKTVAVIVADAFLRERKEGEVIIHKNKVAHDNRVSNLMIASWSVSAKIDVSLGVKTPLNTDGMLSRKRREQFEEKTFIYEDGVLSRILCLSCGFEKDVNEFYFRNDQKLSRRECKTCTQKRAGTLNPGILKYTAELLKAGLRKCSQCNEIKPLEMYSKSIIKGSSGYSYSCKACDKIRKQKAKEKRKQQNSNNPTHPNN